MWQDLLPQGESKMSQHFYNWNSLIKKSATTRTFLKRTYKPCQKHIIHLMFSYKHWASTKLFRNYGEIVQKLMLQTKEKCNTLALTRFKFSNGMKMPWYSACLFVFNYFCSEPTVRKGIWITMASVTVMIIFFENCILNVTWSQLFKIHSQQLRDTLTSAFWKIPYNWISDMDQRTC